MLVVETFAVASVVVVESVVAAVAVGFAVVVAEGPQQSWAARFPCWASSVSLD